MHGRILMKDLEDVDDPSGFNSFCFQNSFFWVVCFLGLPKAQTIDEGSSSSFPLKIDVGAFDDQSGNKDAHWNFKTRGKSRSLSSSSHTPALYGQLMIIRFEGFQGKRILQAYREETASDVSATASIVRSMVDENELIIVGR
ncbi:hypothetical protein POTOM_057406 [Populus tomentosa]|uniref:Uncharacterized protein n=1 Tax=Populus tomentosa TaxID=118781 RepID=A0A8X8BXM2_POPTO|nr:hypothetical protein POTOM_057406 [Populus tomentosa]